jgi:hypothetical protein
MERGALFSASPKATAEARDDTQPGEFRQCARGARVRMWRLNSPKRRVRCEQPRLIDTAPQDLSADQATSSSDSMRSRFSCTSESLPPNSHQMPPALQLLAFKTEFEVPLA